MDFQGDQITMSLMDIIDRRQWGSLMGQSGDLKASKKRDEQAKIVGRQTGQ
jgi:hypothetical protein